MGSFKSVCKKIASATGAQDYNILQNNGRAAHQLVDHVHFHVIPKPSEAEGLGISWPAKDADKGDLQKLCEDLKSKMWWLGSRPASKGTWILPNIVRYSMTV